MVVRNAVRWGATHGVMRLAIRARAGKPDAQVLRDPAVQEDPYGHYERLRTDAPFAGGAFARVSVHHDVCTDVLRSDAFGQIGGGRADGLPAVLRAALRLAGPRRSVGPIDPPSMLAVDPPEHTRYRRLVSRAFSARAAQVHLAADGLSARGVQLGVDPLPYRVDYRLDIAGGWLTRTLEVSASGDGWQRTLRLAHDLRGTWTCEATARGDVDLPDAGGDTAPLAGALDCDLGLSPLTNTMPVLRHGLHRDGGAADLLVAWVSVPDLHVHASRQRYEHLRTTATGAVVRFSSGDFTADLVVDAHGLVTDYPELGTRVSP